MQKTFFKIASIIWAISMMYVTVSYSDEQKPTVDSQWLESGL